MERLQLIIPSSRCAMPMLPCPIPSASPAAARRTFFVVSLKGISTEYGSDSPARTIPLTFSRAASSDMCTRSKIRPFKPRPARIEPSNTCLRVDEGAPGLAGFIAREKERESGLRCVAPERERSRGSVALLRGDVLDVGFELTPADKAVLEGERVLSRGEPGNRIVLLQLAQQQLRLFLQMLQTGTSRQIARHDSSVEPGVR